MAWYRLYRPKQIAELNITSVRQALQQLMQNGKMPQSLLFAGPKGTGKTSASRILGAMLNDPANAELIDHLFFKKAPLAAQKVFVEPDSQSDFARRVYEGHSFVVQELDAASNRRIDDIRLLKERINLPPTEGKMTVYILDEVHMLTTEAFNALLKILEEPPAHVVFILATTELHKIPATIVSRCSVVNFRKASSEELTDALARVLEAEKIQFKREDLLPIALRADGSFRDGVKILEMACQSGKLDLQSVSELLAADSEVYVRKLLDLAIQKDEANLARVFVELRDNNYNQKDFYKDCLAFLHTDLLRNLQVAEGEAVYAAAIDQFFLRELLSVDLGQDSPIPFLVLELKLLEIIARSKKNPPEKTAQTTVRATASPAAPKKPDEKIVKKKIEVSEAESKPISAPVSQLTSVSAPAQPIAPEVISNLKETWQKIIESLAGENFSLQTLLKSCTLDSLSQEEARVSVYYSFHKEQLEQNKNRALLGQVVQNILGLNPNFAFVLRDQAVEAAQDDLVLAAKDSLL